MRVLVSLFFIMNDFPLKVLVSEVFFLVEFTKAGFEFTKASYWFTRNILVACFGQDLAFLLKQGLLKTTLR